jgi:hypothetical protein
MTAHVCGDCGLLHDTPTATETPEVAIARIQAETQLKIEQLRARTDRHIVETEAETAEEIAETEAEASIVGDVASAQIIASEPAAAAAEETGEPIVIEAPAPEAEPEPVTEEPPVVETTPARGKKSGGYWSAYGR